MLCGDLDRKELQKRGGLCVHVAGSLCCAAESSTALRNSCSPIKVSLKKKTDSISILQCFYFNWKTPVNFVFFFFFYGMYVICSVVLFSDLQGIGSVMHMNMKVLATQSCLTLYNLIDQAPLSMGFSRQEYWSG